MNQDDEHRSQHTSNAGNLQRTIQRAQDAADSGARQGGDTGGAAPLEQPVQTGQRDYPGPPMSAQHLTKPGLEADMEQQPQFMAPGYKGSGKLQGMAAIITGGDSGIGRAVAVLYAREGADVALIYLDEETTDALDTQRYVEHEGQRCLLIAGDVREPAFCRAAVAQVMAEYGRLDVLVNNAGHQEHAESIADLSEERFDLTMKTNVYGYFHMAKAALPHMKRGAAIVNTGSVTGLRGTGNLIDYSTTKGAIHAFTMALASNVLPQGIRVNAVAPGPVWTPFNPTDKAPGELAKFGQKSDMHRPGQPEELSPAYVFLASPVCSSYITGMVLPVTGSVGF